MSTNIPRRPLITNQGIDFMKSIASKYGTNGLITGKKSYRIPFSTETSPQTHTANALNKDGNLITTNLQLIDSLVFWINKYSKQYDLDPNIISAQCFVESTYCLWTYAGGDSSACGISQFTIPTFYDIVINNSKREFSEAEINKITVGLSNVGTYTNYYQKAFYTKDSDNTNDKQLSINNRLPLYQNIINNPEILIKAQCILMSEISNNNDNLASSTAFAYNVGSQLKGKDYYDIVNKKIKNSGSGSTDKIIVFKA